MSHTWIMVANSTNARIFEANDQSELKEIETLSHPDGRLHNRDLVTDKPGRTYESASPTRHSEEPRVMPKTLEFEHFADSLLKHLTLAHRNGKFDKLYISANPSFLGILRQKIGKNELAKAVAGEFNVDLTQLNAGEIRKHMPDFL